MSINNCFSIAIKASLLFILLMPLVVLQAQASDVAENPAEAGTGSGSDDAQQAAFSFPRWPESPRFNRDRVPLPPPGPYMSSALSEFSFEGPSFASNVSESTDDFASTESSMEAFSPDIPWPSNVDSPVRWEPENGYRFVEPPAKKESYQGMLYYVPPHYNYGYRGAPAMVPSVGASSGMPYSRAPYGYAPQRLPGKP